MATDPVPDVAVATNADKRKLSNGSAVDANEMVNARAAKERGGRGADMQLCSLN